REREALRRHDARARESERLASRRRVREERLDRRAHLSGNTARLERLRIDELEVEGLAVRIVCVDQAVAVVVDAIEAVRAALGLLRLRAGELAIGEDEPVLGRDRESTDDDQVVLERRADLTIAEAQ